MADKLDPDHDLYRLYLETAEKVSDRRAQANAWMLSVNSAVVALYGYLAKGAPVVAGGEANVWRWAIPAAGMLVCLAWAALLRSYRTLNRAKFEVLQDMETRMPYAPFTEERKRYKAQGRHPLSRAEAIVPWSFAALYLVLIVATSGTG